MMATPCGFYRSEAPLLVDRKVYLNMRSPNISAQSLDTLYHIVILTEVEAAILQENVLHIFGYI